MSKTINISKHLSSAQAHKVLCILLKRSQLHPGKGFPAYSSLKQLIRCHSCAESRTVSTAHREPSHAHFSPPSPLQQFMPPALQVTTGSPSQAPTGVQRFSV